MGRSSDWWVLDLDGDPTPGQPDSVRALAEKFADFADDVERAERQVTGLGNDNAVLSWIGLSGDAYREQIGELPDQLRKLRTSYRLAGDALTAYAPKLGAAQQQADRALAAGREARQRLASAGSQLTGATDHLTQATRTATALNTPPTVGAPLPDPDQVRSALRNQQAAQARLASAQNASRDAQTDLDQARRLALDAKELRLTAARTAANQIDDASDAGIKNKKWFSWEKISKAIAATWNTIVKASKLIVAVLGILVLIIGGPLAWIVLAAALIVLADTLHKYVTGQATLWDVGFAALDCIPGAKGLTTAADLATTTRRLAAGGLPELAATARRGATAAKSALAGAGPRLRSLAGDVRSTPKIFTDMRARNLEDVAEVARHRIAVRQRVTPEGLTMLAVGTDFTMVKPLIATAGATLDALRHTVDTVGSMRGAKITLNADGSYDAALRYNKRWGAHQRANADAKADWLTNNATQYDANAASRRKPNETAIWRTKHPEDATTKEFAVGYDSKHRYDVDHRTDMQLAGKDESENMWYLEKSVNRSEGAQVNALIRRSGMPHKAVINTFTFTERGVGPVQAVRGASYLYTPPSQP